MYMRFSIECPLYVKDHSFLEADRKGQRAPNDFDVL